MSATTTKNPKILKRNKLIRKSFRELTEDKHYRNEYALELLEAIYITLEQSTLWLIITQTGHYKDY